MHILTSASLMAILSLVQSYAQDQRYPISDFYNRSIELPVDYGNPDEGRFFLYYQLTSNFEFARPTIFFFQGGAQEYGLPGKVDELAKSYHFYEDFNVVRYQIRGRKYSSFNLKNYDGSINWERAYALLSSDQVIEDIERIRQDLFKERPDTKIFLYGRSGGGCLIQRYLAKYSGSVSRAFIRAGPNPIIMKQLRYPESKYLYNTLNGMDTSLYGKLKEIIDRNIVPEYQLYWILYHIPYASEDPGEELKILINDLYERKKASYEEYLQRKGFDYSKYELAERNMGGVAIGRCLRPVEISAGYMLDPDPEYIDPFYSILKKMSEPFLKLIREERVAPPSFPPLEKYREVGTEVFYLAGRNDHVTDYRIGIELGKYYKNYELYIADDNHTMSIHAECYPLLRNTFFKHGIESKELQAVRQSLGCKEWKAE